MGRWQLPKNNNGLATTTAAFSTREMGSRAFRMVSNGGQLHFKQIRFIIPFIFLFSLSIYLPFSFKLFEGMEHESQFLGKRDFGRMRKWKHYEGVRELTWEMSMSPFSKLRFSLFQWLNHPTAPSICAYKQAEAVSAPFFRHQHQSWDQIGATPLHW